MSEELPRLYAVARPPPKISVLPPRVLAAIHVSASRFDVRPGDLLGPHVHGAARSARADAWAVLRDMTMPDGRPVSQQRIARWFGVSPNVVSRQLSDGRQ